jgi:Carbohydrate family 9 binding domain-like
MVLNPCQISESEKRDTTVAQCRALLTLILASCSVFLGVPATQTAASTYSSDVHIDAKPAAADFTPDGNLSKKAWKNANWVEFSHSMSGNANYPAQATRVASLWSGKYIYFAFSCKYEVLNVFEGEDTSKERWELWNRDVAEVFLNPQPERQLHYYEFEVAPNNQWIDLEITRGEKPNHDASWNSGFEHAARVDSKNHVWTAEMRMPLVSMGVSEPKPGTEWRANFFRAAGKGADTQRMFLAWSIIPEGTTFHVPSRFGILRLVK